MVAKYGPGSVYLPIPLTGNQRFIQLKMYDYLSRELRYTASFMLTFIVFKLYFENL